MRIVVVTGNPAIERAVNENTGSVEYVFLSDVNLAAAQPADILVADSALVSAAEIVSMNKEMFGRVLYLTQDEIKLVLPGVAILHYDGRPVSAAEQMRAMLASMTVLKNVLTFWSPVAGAGTTMVALTAFRKLPETYRGLFLSLTDTPGVEYLAGGIDGYLSAVLPRLSSRVLDIQDLVKACNNEGNKYYMGGLASVADAPKYTVEDIKALLTMAAGYFDYVVVDAGSGATLMGIAAITTAARTYVVTTQSYIAAVRYEQTMRQCYTNVPEFAESRLQLILNKEDRDMVLGGRTQRQYALPVVGALRAVENAVALRAEYEPGLIYNLDAGPAYRADMEALLQSIYSDIGVSDAEINKKKTGGWFARIKGGK